MMKNSFLIALSIVLSVFFCSSDAFTKTIELPSGDIVLRERIVGKWAEGDSPYGIAIFEKGGGYEALVYEDETKSRFLGMAKGKWWIRNTEYRGRR